MLILEEKKRSLEESLYATEPEFQEKFQKLKEVELEVDSVSSEIRKRQAFLFDLRMFVGDHAFLRMQGWNYITSSESKTFFKTC